MEIVEFNPDVKLMTISAEDKITRQDYEIVEEDDNPFNQSSLDRTDYSSATNPFGDD
jgi:hypothetical protein